MLSAESLSRVRLFVIPWTAAHQASLSMGILQARILEWVALSCSRESSQPRDWTQISYIAGRLLYQGSLIIRLLLLLLLSHYSCVQLCARPHRQHPTRFLHLWDFPVKNTGVGCHFLPQCMHESEKSKWSQSCPTLCDPMDCSLPGFSVRGIFQARVLEWSAIAFSNLRTNYKININTFNNIIYICSLNKKKVKLCHNNVALKIFIKRN